MTKKEAAEVLGKSTRTVNEYVATGRLKATYRNGKNGQEVFFDEADVQQLKAELQTPTHRGQVLPAANNLPVPAGNPQVWDRFVNALESLAHSSRLTPLLEGAADERGKHRVQLSLSELSVKPVLRVSEAQRLTGIPYAVLRQAIEEGKLKAVENTLGHGRRIKRADLDAFIAKA